MTTLTSTTIKTVTVEHTQARRIRCTARIDMPEYGLVAGQRFHLVRVSGTTYEIKKIEIIERRELTNGSVWCLVRNGENKEYGVTLNHFRHNHTCSCDAYVKGHLHCYHVEYVRSIENARAAEEKAARVAAEVGITTEQVQEIATCAAQAKLEKQEALEQHQAELDVAQLQPNYRTMSSIEAAAPAWMMGRRAA